MVSGTAPGSDLPERFGLGLEFYLHYKERSKLLDGIFVFAGGTSTLRTDNRVERIPMAWPTNDMYATLGVRPQLGRLPAAEDGDRVVLISDRLWSHWFGRDPAVIGKSYFVSGEMRQVIGVMPPEFRFPSDDTMLWVASELPAGRNSPRTARRSRDRAHEARSDAGTARHGADAALEGAAGALRRARPNYARIIEQHNALVEPLLDRLVGPIITSRCGCCWARFQSCCSSPAPTSPICSWCAPKGAAATWRCVARLVRRGRSSCDCRWPKRFSSRWRRAHWPSSSAR